VQVSDEVDGSSGEFLATDETLSGTLAHASRAPVGAAIDRGAAIGRYVVLSKLGAGAMGVVLAAYDPELDRKVALKLLRAAGDDKARARLQREAQALAKLDHHNVVAVHDVGVHDEQLFVAMEFVEGQTLGAWMRSSKRPHPWPEVVRVFAEAGRGLAAAHGAGLVHRDFKPDNVMISSDGRVRVMDFGLARAIGEDPGAEAPAPEQHNPVRLGLTQTGALLGTPAYMAPEQFVGVPADAHSDQFGFCVALYEALYGQRPFRGSTLGELIYAIESERIESPWDTSVPSWLRKVVLRGVAKTPAQRWPSMQALLEALTDDPAVRRRKWWAVAAVVGLLGGAAWALFAAVQREAQTCTGMDDKLVGSWDVARRAEVEAALLGTSLGHARDTWERVAWRLDDYADAWVAARVDACEASHRGEQSGELLDRRMACLDDRLRQLQATVDELAHADATVLGRAVQMVSGLPQVERCADAEALMAEVPPPEDPSVRERVAALDEQLVVAQVKHEAGKYDTALEIVDAVTVEAEALGYEPLQVRAWLLQGSLQISTGEYAAAEATFVRAYDGALAKRMINEAAQASSWLLYVVGYHLGRPADARRWAVDADPLSRATDSNETRSSYFESLSAVAEMEGNFDEAREHEERALALLEAAHGPDHLALASLLNNLGIVADLQGDLAQARHYYERGLAIREREQGPHHPLVGTCLANLAGIAFVEGKLPEARRDFERAVAIQEAALGREHPDLADALNGLGIVARTEGKYDEARRLYLRALPILERAHGLEHPDVGNLVANLGNLAMSQDKIAEAIPYFERTLAIRIASKAGPQLLAEARFALAQALWWASPEAGGDRVRARELAEQAGSNYAELGEASAESLRDVEVWLAKGDE
jgi:tetratricopeptide (TPR) repeat protein/predicted Ser/Thr protein kinase